ncbi:MAG: hypothetical protein R3174_12915 [Gammaproteobacteria bacterium]|nr:hypothetical protein [Gammaproteobacteria bacterium]
MKAATPVTILLGCALIAASIASVPSLGSKYQIVRLTEGRIARLDQRSGEIAYCSVQTRNAERFIVCAS